MHYINKSMSRHDSSIEKSFDKGKSLSSPKTSMDNNLNSNHDSSFQSVPRILNESAAQSEIVK